MRKRFVTTLIFCMLAVACVFGFTACGGEQDPVSVTGIILNMTELTLEFGSEETLTATVLPENATDKTVIWTSSDESVATVKDGKVSAIKAGTANITAKSGEFSATCALTVKTRKLTEAEWKAAIEATLSARNLTMSAKEGTFGMEFKFDWNNKTICQGDSDYTVAENGSYYSYTLRDGKWNKSQLTYGSDEEMFDYAVQRSFGRELTAAKNAYSSAKYDAVKDEYTVTISLNGDEEGSEYVMKFAEGKVSKYSEGRFEVTFSNFGTTVATLPEAAENA